MCSRRTHRAACSRYWRVSSPTRIRSRWSASICGIFGRSSYREISRIQPPFMVRVCPVSPPWKKPNLATSLLITRICPMVGSSLFEVAAKIWFWPFIAGLMRRSVITARTQSLLVRGRPLQSSIFSIAAIRYPRPGDRLPRRRTPPSTWYPGPSP